MLKNKTTNQLMMKRVRESIHVCDNAEKMCQKRETVMCQEIISQDYQPMR